ncbi:MAG: hypothetical protein NTX97_08350 [Bacteroidetes bacterium]|nr:hypothetical protein [Bacteroidota bacterium]
MRKIIILAIIIISFYPSATYAQDRTFVRTYQSTTLPKDTKDLELCNTFRTGRQYFYNRLDQRLELEVGLTDKLQTSVYLNVEYSAEGAHLDTLGSIADTSIDGIFRSTLFSVSSEWKLKLSDPVANAIGSAIYAELTFSPTEFEFEGKLILDKKTENNSVALNIVGEYEVGFDIKKGKTIKEEAFKPEVDIAYMHMFKPNVGLGLEVVQKNVLVSNKLEHAALFGGPSLFYSGDGFFIILNALPQWKNLQMNNENPNRLNVSEFEKAEIRLLIGFSF